MNFNRCMGCFEEYDDNLEVCPFCGYKKDTPVKELIYLEPETILHGKYIIGKVLGAGGFGVTYIAYDLELERKVAIKEYFPGELATRMPGQTNLVIFSGEKSEQFKAGVESFVDEARRLAKFNSVDGIVHIFDTFTENSTAYLVMEFLNGETLKEMVPKKVKVSYQRAVEYILPVLRELERVHSVGIIHRDIAPDNIFVTRDGKVKLIDFGASRFATFLHSKSLSVVLKSGYAPEEQYHEKGVQGPWTDVYAVSATLYRLITGEVPPDAQERKGGIAVLKKPSELGIDIPENIEIAIMNGMNVYAENRYQSAKEFADVLEKLVPAKPIEENLKRERDGKLPKKAIIGMVSGIAVAVAILITLLSTGTLKRITAERLPNVSGMSVEEAAEILLNYGYQYITGDETTEAAENKIRIEEKIYDLQIPENMILSQSPNGGAKVDIEKYPDIYLTLSAGAREVFLPENSFIGMKKEDAVAQLEALGLIAEISEDKSSEIAPGYICAQQYLPETKLKEGETVNITVSTGTDGERTATTVPRVTGLSQERASELLSQAKLFMAVGREEYSNTVPKGVVISQNPVEGSGAFTNETVVSVVVSKGAKADETTRVPDITNRKQERAVSLLKSANLNYTIEYAYSNNIASGTVISQSIKADTKVKVGTTITVTVSKGAKNDSSSQIEQATQRPPVVTKPVVTENNKITVANVVGLTEANAKSRLGGCTVSVTYGYCNGVAKGAVIKQAPAAGTKVNKGSSVSLIVSLGSKDSNFSAWSTSKPSGNVITEQKTQYRSIDLKEVASYGAWSSTQQTKTKPVECDTLKIVNTWVQYHYYHYLNWYSNSLNNWNIDSKPWGNSKGRHDIYINHPLGKISFPDKGNQQAYGGSPGGYNFKEDWCCQDTSAGFACHFYIWFYAGETTFYQYQTRTKSTSMQEVGSWSGWGDAKITASNTQRVETRTVYRSCPNYKTYDSKGNII